MKALAFDLDNTLFDHRAAMDLFLTGTMGIGDRDVVDRLLDFDAAGTTDRRRFCRRVARVLEHSVTADDVWCRLRTGFARALQPQPQLTEMLRQAASQFEIALLTNGGSQTQRAKIDALDLHELFGDDRIVVSAELGVEKPGPEPFLEVLDRLGLDARHTLYVGDDPHNDIAGARAVGMRTCWVAWGRAFPDTPGPDWTIEHVLELPAIWHQFQT
jgi:putative hydrolase of the HAD superfamily